MKKLQKLHRPENYILTDKDIENIGEFDSLLDHLTNVVNSEPLHKIGLNRIGIGNLKAMVSIESMEKPNIYTPVLCEVITGVDLWGNRGIHMSRCVQSVFNLAKLKYKTLDDFTLELAKTVRDIQESEMGFAEVSGTYIHKRYTRKTTLESYDNITLISKATLAKNNEQLKTGMKVYNATACPCTKVYTKYSTVPKLKEMGLTLQQIQQILDTIATGTHMQLGPTVLLIDKEKSQINHKQIYEVLDNSLHLVYELLKRPDEHDFVKSTIDKPQFTEDAARDAAYSVYTAFNKKLSSKAELYVESILQDSIHTHDVRTVIHKTFGEMKKELDL